LRIHCSFERKEPQKYQMAGIDITNKKKRIKSAGL
jgi:endonuclease YncB( thermonuclease family)